jgi:hypothetical protein
VTHSARAFLALMACVAAVQPARAAEVACRFENDVVVIPAEVLGVSGDYILDTATPHTQLGDTQAQAEGFEGKAQVGEIRMAGVVLVAQPVAIADIDMRTGALPTPIAGIIGVDALRSFVLEVSFAPCRVGLWPAGHPSTFRAETTLPLTWIAGRPTAQASVTDGALRLTGAFALGVGADTAVRVSDAAASAPGAAKPLELYPYGVLRPRLAGLTFAGAEERDLRAGLIAAEDPDLVGQIGAPILAHYRLRFDFPTGRLLLRRER